MLTLKGRVVRLLFAATLFMLLPAGLSLAQSNPVVVENQNPGTTDWVIDGYGSDAVGQIKGYASATSINKGESIQFFVSVNPAQTYTIDVYRIGWYQGLGGRLMTHVGPLNGIQQPTCPTDPTTGMISCAWSSAYTLTTGTDWTSGVYLALLRNAAGYRNYITFVLRDDSRVGTLLFQMAVTTDQAYNNYPDDNKTGKSLYDFNSYGSINQTTGTKAGYKVSFDRPYSGVGVAESFLEWDVDLIRWIEKMGYDVTYSTNIDTHTSGANLANYKAFISPGHDEYWSKPMYDAVVAARDAGVNLAFFGADAIYWQIRLESSTAGAANRVIVCYYDAVKDPETDSSLKTVLWRDPPLNRPEQTLIGVQFTNLVATTSGTYQYPPHVVTNSGHWVYAGTGLVDGDKINGIVGYEADHFFSGTAGPPAVPGTYTLLSRSPFTASDGPDFSNASIYQAASGAWVFGAGTIQYGWGLDSPLNVVFAPWFSDPNVVNPKLQQMTKNILDRFVASSAGGPDFLLGVSPTARTINPGNSTDYTVTINPSGGFADPVTFEVAGLPTGANAVFTPNPASSSSVMSITTGPDTPTGTYTLTITGVGGSRTHTATVTLSIVVPDYTLTATPATRSVAQGATANYTVSVNPVGGFADQVTLAVTGLPVGASASFTPNPATSSSTLAVVTTGNTPGGSYTLTITGTSGTLSHSTTVTLTVSTGITVTAPNTAVSWKVTSNQNITFSHTLGVGQVINIDVSRDGGSSWTNIGSMTTTSATSGTYAWTVTGPATSQARIRVSSAATPSVTDTSDVNFTIVNPTITVTAPNTAVNWQAGVTKNITFSHTMGIGQPVLIEVSRDGGATFSTIGTMTTTSATSGSYAWLVVGPATKQALVRVSWTVDSTVSDRSDVNFAILPRTTVTAPNTAVTWGAGSTRQVTWNHNLGVGALVNIDFSPDLGASWVSVAAGVPCSSSTKGSYVGPMPNIVTTQGLIRVYPAAELVNGDTSDVAFTLATPMVKVTAPNTAVSWSIGSNQVIKWNHNLGTRESVKIELARDGVNFNEVIAASVVNSANTTGSYTWNVTGPSTATAKIRVTWLRETTVTDASDVNFRIP